MNFCDRKTGEVDGLESQPRKAGKLLSITIIGSLMISLGSATYTSDFSISQPFNPDNKNMPQHYDASAGGSINLDFAVDTQSKSTGTFTLQKKTADDTSWTDVSSTEYFDHWGSNKVYFNTVHSFSVTEGSSKTVSYDGTERTIGLTQSDVGAQFADIAYEGSTGDTLESGETFDKGNYGLADTEFFYVEEVFATNKTFQISTGESYTQDIGGQSANITLNSITDNDDSIFVTVNGNDANYDQGDVFSVNGKDVEVTEVIPVGNGDGDTKFTIIAGGSNAVKVNAYDQLTVQEGDQYEYRARFEGSEYSRPIYFDVSTSDGFNIPFVENVSVDNSLQYDFQTGTVKPQSSISAVVKQSESDNYNITLRDRGNNVDVETATVKSGTVSNLYSETLNIFLGSFTDTSGFQSENLDKVTFSVSGADLLSTSASSYNYGLRIKDFDGSLTRKTVDYGVDTSGENDPPNITAVEGFTGSSWKPVQNFDTYGEPFEQIRVKIDDANNDLVEVNLNLTEVYDGTSREDNFEKGYNFDEKNGDNYIFNLSKSKVPTSEINDSGGWRVSVRSDDGGKSDSEVRTWSVPWGDLSVEQLTPSSDQTVNLYEEFTWEVKVGCSGGECVNENETLRVWPDPFSLDGAEAEVVQ